MAYENNSLDRAMNMVDVVSRHPGLTLKELSAELEANQTTVLRTARVLERHGIIRRDSRTLAYHLGTRLVELGNAAAKGLDAVSSLLPIAEELTNRFLVTAHIGLFYDGMVTVVGKTDPRELTVRYSSLGTRMPLHATAAGKAVLAMLGVSGLAALGLRSPMQRYGPRSIDDPALLVPEIEATRRRGFSLEKEEFQPGFACVGSAVSLDGDIYAISLSGQLADDDVLERRGGALKVAMDEYVNAHRGLASGLPLEVA